VSSRRSQSAFAATNPTSSARVRRAVPREARQLRELAHRSKAHWPYSARFLEAARPLLQLTEADVAEQEVHVLERDGVVLGWHRVTFHENRAELEDLWLEPAVIGKGHGRELFDHAAALARGKGASVLEWDAEPFARGFYEAMGGIEIGRTPSAALPGRTLPRMRLELG
jgi:GNAT superfamily N-acetyltransferase